MSTSRPKHWSALKGQERADGAWAAGKVAWGCGTDRRVRMREAYGRYLGRAGAVSSYPEHARWGLVRAMVSSIVSRVGALAAPRAQFVTSDADWRTRRTAQGLDRFVDGLGLQECGAYASIHELRTAVLQDALVCGIGACVVAADTEAGRVVTERVLPWELCWSQADARYGSPRETWRRYPMSRAALCEWYPKGESAILSAGPWSGDQVSDVGLDTKQESLQDYVEVFEVWRTGVDGRHLVLIGGSERGGCTALLDEEWEHDNPPIVMQRWDHPVVGGEGLSLASEVAPAEDEINLSLWRISDTMRRTSMNYILAGNGTTFDEQGGSVDAAIVRFTGEAPVMVTPDPVSPSHLQWIETLYARAYEQVGISQMAATGERQPGLSSGTAIRNATAVQSQRFAWLSRQQDAFICAWAQQVVNAAKLCAEADPDFGVSWPSDSGTMRSIKWADVDLERDQYLVQVHPVSEAKNSPAARAERAEELLARGMMSPQAYQAATSGTYDTERQEQRARVQADLIDSYIERWLDADEEDAERARDPNASPIVPAPIKWLDLPSAIVQVGQAYLQAELDGAPDLSKQLMATWLSMCEEEIQKQAAAMAPPPQPTAGGAPIPGPPTTPGVM